MLINKYINEYLEAVGDARRRDSRRRSEQITQFITHKYICNTNATR